MRARSHTRDSPTSSSASHQADDPAYINNDQFCMYGPLSRRLPGHSPGGFRSDEQATSAQDLLACSSHPGPHLLDPSSQLPDNAASNTQHPSCRYLPGVGKRTPCRAVAWPETHQV